MCQASYSTKLAERMLTQMAELDSSPSSLYQLRRFSILHQNEASQCVRYAQWFLTNLEYLRELRRNFNQRIYEPLCCYYQQEERDAATPGSASSQRSHSVLELKHDFPEVKDIYDYSDIENIMSRLSYITPRWQHLLEDEGKIEPLFFSVNSESVVSESCPATLRHIARLIPDVLVKCVTAGGLARRWVCVAGTKAIDSHTRLDKLERVRTEVSGRLDGLRRDIENEEGQLERATSDLETLIGREERCSAIMSAEYAATVRAQELQGQLQTAREELQALLEAREAADPGAVHAKQVEIIQLEKELALHSFSRAVLTEDLSVELEIKPSIIRFANQLQDNCERLEETLDNKRTERLRLESALVPITEDSRRAQDLISRQSTAKSQQSLTGESNFR